MKHHDDEFICFIGFDDSLHVLRDWVVLHTRVLADVIMVTSIFLGFSIKCKTTFTKTW